MNLNKIYFFIISIIILPLPAYASGGSDPYSVLFWFMPFIVILFLYLFNETGFLHFEKTIYTEPDLTRLMDPRAAPVLRIKKRDRAVMFIHGFPSTPSMFAGHADAVEKAGYDVIAPLLPGFGTRPEDLIETDFSRWYEFIRVQYLKYRANYKYFYIAGASMGGALTLKLAEEFSSDKIFAPTAVCTASAPVFLNSFFAHRHIQNPAIYLVRIIALFTKYIPGHPPETEGPSDGEDEWVGYHGIFPAQTYSLKVALRKINRDLAKITVPVYLAHSKGDTTISIKNLYRIADAVSSPDISVKIFDLRRFSHTRHSLFLYKSSGTIMVSCMLDFFQRMRGPNAR